MNKKKSSTEVTEIEKKDTLVSGGGTECETDNDTKSCCLTEALLLSLSLKGRS